MGRPRIIRRATLYRGRVIRLIREVLEVEGRRLVRETIQHPGAVVIVPVLGDGRVVFVRQYRRAVGRVLLELPAGTLEPGERRAACARRELEEETGWRASRFRRIAQFYAAPGFISEQLTVFLATGLTQAAANPEPDELIEPVCFSFRGALARIRSGAICDAKTIIGILFAHQLLRRDLPGARGWLGKDDPFFATMKHIVDERLAHRPRRPTQAR
jgi:ADP-ribose pyrophosphatase